MTSQPALIVVKTRSLSPREAQIARALANDKSQKEISRDLGLSEKTVQRYCQSIREKMGTQSLIAAVSLAVQMKITRVYKIRGE